MAHPVIHWEIGGRDGTRLQKFYAELFDWKVTAADPGYGLVAPEDGGIGGGIMEVHGDVPAYVTVYVAVTGLDDFLARAKDLGGAVIQPPTPIPGVGAFALFRDPDGNVVGMLEAT